MRACLKHKGDGMDILASSYWEDIRDLVLGYNPQQSHEELPNHKSLKGNHL